MFSFKDKTFNEEIYTQNFKFPDLDTVRKLQKISNNIDEKIHKFVCGLYNISIKNSGFNPVKYTIEEDRIDSYLSEIHIVNNDGKLVKLQDENSDDLSSDIDEEVHNTIQNATKNTIQNATKNTTQNTQKSKTNNNCYNYSSDDDSSDQSSDDITVD